MWNQVDDRPIHLLFWRKIYDDDIDGIKGHLKDDKAILSLEVKQ
jgi:hypothetical protein